MNKVKKKMMIWKKIINKLENQSMIYILYNKKNQDQIILKKIIWIK